MLGTHRVYLRWFLPCSSWSGKRENSIFPTGRNCISPPPSWQHGGSVRLSLNVSSMVSSTLSLQERKFLLLVMGSTLDNSKIYLRKRFSNVTHTNIHRTNHGLIDYIDTKAKCRHLKKSTCKGTLLQVAICLRTPPLLELLCVVV